MHLEMSFFVSKGTTKVVDGKLVVMHFVCYKEGFSKCIVPRKANVSKNLRLSREMKCGYLVYV